MLRRWGDKLKTNIFIPKTIRVGFQERSDTYTQKLAYVIYIDEKGKLRKEASWNSWRDKKIDPIDYPNEPTSGFVLNKKAGGYSTGWNHRQTYVRVYDPRNFEFEISIPNLLYILENTNSIKGKGLEGEFVYGWDGSELVLIPTSSPDYIEISQFNKILHEKTYIKAKDLILGATYKTKHNEEWIYLGRFDYYGFNSESQGKRYFFYSKTKKYYPFEVIKSLGDKIISVVSEDCAENYAELIEKLESQTIYSPYDESKDEYLPYDYNSFVNRINSGYWGVSFYSAERGYEEIQVRKNYPGNSNEDLYNVIAYNPSTYWNRETVIFKGALKTIYDIFKPMYKNKYLKNGKLYQRGE
jgi:hypothetical protein